MCKKQRLNDCGTDVTNAVDMNKNAKWSKTLVPSPQVNFSNIRQQPIVNMLKKNFKNIFKTNLYIFI